MQTIRMRVVAITSHLKSMKLKIYCLEEPRAVALHSDLLLLIFLMPILQRFGNMSLSRLCAILIELYDIREEEFLSFIQIILWGL